jgi:AraC-like DNA-binding protein
VKEVLPIPSEAPGTAFLQCLPGYLHPRHRHDELELNLVVRGTATYQVGSRLHGIQRGSLLWLFPGQDHVVLDKSDDYTVWIVYWRASLIRQVSTGDPTLAILASSDPSGWFCRRIGNAEVKRLDQLLRELESAASPALVHHGLAYALTLAWSLFSAGQEDAPMASLHPAVQRAARIVSTGQELSLPAMAQSCGLSPARLSSLFSTQMGIPLSAYRNQRRLERFLVEHDPRSGNLLASALSAGFGSYSQFHRQFTRLMGISPQAWELREREQPSTVDRRPRGRRL